MSRRLRDVMRVFRKYLRGFFTCDLLSAIPVEVFHVIVVGKGNVKWYSTVMNLTKIFRLRNVIFYSRRLTPVSGIFFCIYFVRIFVFIFFSSITVVWDIVSNVQNL